MDKRAIGVFDSGVGGLTVLREIIKRVPNEHTLYFGDTARVPYGPRDLDQVREYVFKITRFLVEKDVKLIVIACNTSTAAALEDIKKMFDIPIIGVIGPGARAAATSTLNKHVGVIATKGTVESNAYGQEIKKIDSQIMLHPMAAPLLVEYVEKGILNGSSLDRIICSYIGPLIEKNIDTLILGCTHFPLIEDRIASLAGKKVRIVSSAVETAKDVQESLCKLKIQRSNSNPDRIYYETGNASKFFEVGKMFLGEEIKEVCKIHLEL